MMENYMLRQIGVLCRCGHVAETELEYFFRVATGEFVAIAESYRWLTDGFLL